MFSKHNYSPSVRFPLSKSRSTGDFYKQATERSLKYQSSVQEVATDCQACRHQNQKNIKITTIYQDAGLSKKFNNYQANEYYKIDGKDQLSNLRKSKRFLEELLDRQKQQHKMSVDIYQSKLNRMNEQLQESQALMIQLQNSQNNAQIKQQYLPSASLVRSYAQINDKDDEEKIKDKKIRQLGRKNQKLEEELGRIKEQWERCKQELMQFEQLKQKMREYEIYAKEYESMRILISKMQEQKEQILMDHQKQIVQIEERQKQLSYQTQINIDQLHAALQMKDKEIQQKNRQIEKTRFQSIQIRNNQYEHLQELIEQKDKQCESLNVKIRCVESELNFIKNKFGNLLRIAKDGKFQQSIPAVNSAEDVQQFCIQRVGRYNVSTGKESLISMNLSPIKRR